MTTGSIAMPRYQCSKIVRALKIADVVHRFTDTSSEGGAELVPVAGDYAAIHVDGDFVTRHQPRAGGYLVVYEDGYQSFSPAAPFEAGYALLDDAGRRSSLSIERIAQVCHEANRAYCASIGDLSQPTWDYAPDWQRQSAINGVRFHLEAHERGEKPAPSASHDSWLEEKRVAGWCYGPEKNPELKQHPCFVAYEELPLEQRLKDSLFGNIVEALR